MAVRNNSYKAPILAGVILFALSLGWAWLYWQTIRDRERDQLARLSGSLAASLELVGTGDLAAAGGCDAALRQVVRDRLVVRKPILYVRLVRDGRVVAKAGSVPRGMRDPLLPGLTDDGRVIVFHFPVGAPGWHRPPSADEPPPGGEPPPPHDWPPPPPPGAPTDPHQNVPWRWRPAAGLRPATLIVGCDTALPRHVFEKNGPEIVFALLVGWTGIVALVLAWCRSIRSRGLASALEAERRERARLEEMRLAAAGLAHETKNPLGIILGLAQRLASDREAAPSAREKAEQIIDAADRAAARLGSFIHFARMPAPDVREAAAAALLERVATALQAEFEDAGVRLVVEAPPALALWCDPAMLEQVLVNLLLNSLQASAPGSTTTLRLQGHGATAALAVADEGRGIAPELLPHVLEPYVTGRSGGHGLGLAVVKRIVEQHGWSLDIQSHVGRGTTVTLAGIRVAHAPGRNA